MCPNTTKERGEEERYQECEDTKEEERKPEENVKEEEERDFQVFLEERRDSFLLRLL